MPFIEARDGTRIHYQDWGKGRPVVLLHGWPLTADMWEYQSRPLAVAGNRVITYDRRGFGRSGQPWGDHYDYDTLSADLDALMQKLDLRDAALVGFSMGGGEVARYLSRFGADRVRTAVLVASVTPMLARAADHPDGADPEVFEQMQRDLEEDRPKFITALCGKLFGTAMSHEMVEWNRAMAMQASPQATIACLHGFSRTDFRADLVRIDVPTLVIHGDRDESVPIDITGRKAAQLLRNGRLEVYRGAPHGIPLTHRERLARDLVGYLAT